MQSFQVTGPYRTAHKYIYKPEVMKTKQVESYEKLLSVSYFNEKDMKQKHKN